MRATTDDPLGSGFEVSLGPAPSRPGAAVPRRANTRLRDAGRRGDLKRGKDRGRARLRTWAYACGLNVASEQLARAPRRPLPQARQDQDWARLPDRQSPDPHPSAALREVLCALQSGVERE